MCFFENVCCPCTFFRTFLKSDVRTKLPLSTERRSDKGNYSPTCARKKGRTVRNNRRWGENFKKKNSCKGNVPKKKNSASGDTLKKIFSEEAFKVIQSMGYGGKGNIKQCLK